MSHATSRDGTRITYERIGDGPPIVLVSGALGVRAAAHPLTDLLSVEFTVFSYDRRGRADSGDTAPYAVDREVEDLAVVAELAGGSPYVYGTSSGGNLVLEAMRQGLPLAGAALWEPNFLVDGSRPPLPHDYVQHLQRLVGEGRRLDAVEYFMTAAVGIPAEYVGFIRDSPARLTMEAVAHTLAYDGAIVGDSMSGRPVDPERWSGVTAPVLVLDGGQSPWLTAGADAIAAALPAAERVTLPGQPHDVAADALTPELSRFFHTAVSRPRRGD